MEVLRKKMSTTRVIWPYEKTPAMIWQNVFCTVVVNLYSTYYYALTLPKLHLSPRPLYLLPLPPSIYTITANSSKPGSVPMLSRPPSDRKGRRGKEKGQTQDSNGLGTPDLLSGFELEGASNASVNASNRALLGGGGASATASSGGNFFAGFATPAGNAATPTGGGGAGMVAAKGIVGSQAGAIVAGGQGKTGVACEGGWCKYVVPTQSKRVFSDDS